MSLLLQWIVFGFVVLMCVRTRVAEARKRRQSFFSFPDDDNIDYGGNFENPFFTNRFREQGTNRNQFGSQQGPWNNQPQGRVPFPTPILPGPPAIINSPQTSTTTVTPDTIVTTASPAFHACMQNCPTTSEYNPICGTNRQLYFNQQKFNCAIKCGARAEIWRRGSCEGLFTMMRG